MPRGRFSRVGPGGFLAEKQPGSVVPKCKDTQASGALPPLLLPRSFPVMSPGLGTSCHFQELPPCPSAAHPNAPSSRDKCRPTTCQFQVPGCPSLFLFPQDTHLQTRAEGPHPEQGPHFAQCWPGA